MVKSVYIHIPFCSDICSYCDFCKMFYSSNIVKKYLEELKNEVIKNYKNEVIETIYIGGGTPSCLNINELKQLFEIISLFNLSKNIEFTFECNLNIDKEKLQFLFNNKVNRLSFGVQSFNENNLNFLNRKHTKDDIFNTINNAKKIGFNNINIDLIYALPNQTLKQLEEDLDLFLMLDVNHISTYSLLIEPNTVLFNKKIKNIDEDLDYEMYKLINKKLKDFNHYEISNFAKEGYESKHNLTYWNNLEYYGFGLSSSSYLNNKRCDNTRSINSYLNGNYILTTENIDLKRKLEYEFILGFRKIKGINKKDFYNKYNFNILDNKVINKLVKENKLINDKYNIYINPDYIYIQNTILEEFID